MPDLDALRAAVEEAGGVEREARGSGEVWRYELDGAYVTAWRTGTVRTQGKGPGLAILDDLLSGDARAAAPPDPPATGRAAGPPDPLATPRAAAPPDPLAALPRDRPWIGVDESGKGDYFGPLVSAAVRVDPATAATLEDLGVADSKKLSDKRVNALAPRIRELTSWTRTVISPRRYNELYPGFRGLNHMLGWAHARSIEDLLADGHEPAYAIVDQFADKSVVERALLQGTRDQALRVVQFPRAEADVAVAAASILAREEFLRRVGSLPRGGGSDAVVAAARAIVDREGEQGLASVAKLHFGTTSRVLDRRSG
jgi:ribonuclease HIII